jgi:hypothetical protein
MVFPAEQLFFGVYTVDLGGSFRYNVGVRKRKNEEHAQEQCMKKGELP